MNRVLSVFVMFFSLSILVAQTSQVELTQTPGSFMTENLDLEEGQVQFKITNNDVDHEVGFVLVPKGKYTEADHIKTAYVKATVPTGKSSMTNIVTLTAGEYEYFCPLNPTPKYALTVHDEVKTVKMEQTPGIFTNGNMTLSEGAYTFNITNNGVDHEVGFVLVPAGKYDPVDHIKPAYVKAPVADGKNSMTNVVTLEAGDYEYFCPLNPTEKYKITVVK